MQHEGIAKLHAKLLKAGYDHELKEHTRLNGEVEVVPTPSRPFVNAPTHNAPHTARNVNQHISSISL